MIYKLHYKYHNNNNSPKYIRSFEKLEDIVGFLSSSSDFQDKEGNFYWVCVYKDGELSNSLCSVNDLIASIQKLLSKQNSQSFTSQYKEENTTMASKTAFEYTVILHAIPVKDNSGNDITPDSEILINSQTVIAFDVEHVKRIASRKIDSKITDSDLARVEIKVRTL